MLDWFPFSGFTTRFIRSNVRILVEVIRDNNIEQVDTICSRIFDCRSFESALIYYNNQVLHYGSVRFSYIVRMSMVVSGQLTRHILFDRHV